MGVGVGTWAIVGVLCLCCSAGVAQGGTGLQQTAEKAGEVVQKASAATGLDLVTLASFVLAALVLVGLWFAKVLRPGALGAHGLRKADEHPWWVWLLCGFMVFFCGQLGGILVASVPALTGPAPATSTAEALPRYQAVLQIAAYSASLATAAVLLRLLKAQAPQAGLTVTAKSLGLGVLCLLMVLPVVNAVSVLAVMVHQAITGTEIPTRLAHPVLQSLHAHGTDPWAWVVAGVAVVAAPIQEEILFRGFLQTAVLRLTGRPWWSILIASAIFAAIHPMEWYAKVSVFVLGLGMGLAFERTKSLGTSIAMHVGFNALNVAIAIWGQG
jgi:membrane protease YdiL (CAAX protease family)